MVAREWAFTFRVSLVDRPAIIKAILRKVDWRIMSIVAVGCFAVNLDRVNINQANSASFLVDLRLTTDGDSG